MKNTRRESKPLCPTVGEAPAGDWFFDELMTAQPEATQEYFRARLRPQGELPTPRRRASS